MSNVSGKGVDYLGVVPRTSRGQLSPESSYLHTILAIYRVQVLFIHYLSDQFRHSLSPPYFSISPLIEHYLYPVSTAPINNPTKEKIKERY
jgi:hypothetical protein